MIVCKSCGNRNADREEFCASCGRYLAWSGEHVDDPQEEVAPEAEPEPAAVEARRQGIIERLRVAIGVPQRQPGGQPGAEAVDDAVPNGSTAQSGRASSDIASDPDEAAETPGLSSSDGSVVGVLARDASDADENQRLDTGVVSVVPAGALADGQLDAAGFTNSSSTSLTAQLPTVTTRRPGEPAALAVPLVAPDTATTDPSSTNGERGAVLRRPTEVQGAARTARKRSLPADVARVPAGPQPGDVICHRCEQFNPPTRIFCRRCGEELHPELAPGAAPKYTTLDFWQRHLHRDVEITAAGKRPGRWGRAVSGGGGQGLWVRVMTRGLAGLAGLLLVLSLIGPAAQPLRDWYANLYRSLVHKVDITYTQVFAIGANATSQIPAHPASYAVDDGSNTYWQSKPTPHDGVGQAIVIVFAQPTNIDRIGIINGAGPSQQTFLKETAPKEVVLTFTGRNSHYTIHEHLQDTRSFQRLAVAAKDATSMTMRIISVYPSPLKSKSVAVTEIEFFQRT